MQPSPKFKSRVDQELSMSPAEFWLLDLNDRAVASLGKVTSLDIYDGSATVFHEDGLYSTKIFGRVGSYERESRMGYIELKVDILHPKVYRDLCRLKGLYKELIAGRTKAVWVEADKDFNIVKPQNLEDAIATKGNEYGTGYAFFMRYFDKIVFKTTASTERQDRIDFINKNRGRPTIHRIAVIPASYRDLEVSDTGKVTKDEINDLYYSCISIANTIYDTRDKNSSVLDTVRNTLTNRVLDIYTLIESMIEGKKGIMLHKWGSRKTDHGTRNVLSVANHTRDNIKTGRGPDFTSVTVGLWQTMKGLTPFTIYALKSGYLSNVFNTTNNTVPLIDVSTFESSMTEIHHTTKELWSSNEGLLKIINGFVHKEARHTPVLIEGKSPMLIYRGPDMSFKILYDISELPADRSRKDVSPITWAEFFYLSAYTRWYEFYGLVTRYPIAGIDSIYPAQIYLKTTAVGEVRYELQEDWSLDKTPSRTAIEFPRRDVPLFHDTMSPATPRLTGLGADFDGDTGSLVYLMDSTSISECKAALYSRQAWISPNGQLRASMAYDTTNYTLRYLTGEPEARPR